MIIKDGSLDSQVKKKKGNST